jgi:hypothetical protein
VRRVLLICVLALAFASPAFGADIYVSNNSSLPQEQLADALPTFQQALDEDFAPTWREASGSRLILGKAPQRTEYGMSSGLRQFVGDDRLVSNETKARIGREVERLVAAAYAGALALLEAHRRELDKLAKRLLEAREFERVDIVSVLG